MKLCLKWKIQNLNKKKSENNITNRLYHVEEKMSGPEGKVEESDHLVKENI